MTLSPTYSRTSFRNDVKALAIGEPVFASIISEFGYPDFWTRPASFATLVRIILEQQVSLASGAAVYAKLRMKVGAIEPQCLVDLSDEDYRACALSRQKSRYVRELAKSVASGDLPIDQFGRMSNQDVYDRLVACLGIGDWSASIFLMIALRRRDYFPYGDVSLVKSLKHEFNLPLETSVEEIDVIVNRWRPNRTLAAFLLWHAYLRRRNRKIDYDM